MRSFSSFLSLRSECLTFSIHAFSWGIFKSLRIGPPEVQTCNYCVCDVFVLILLFLFHFYRQKKARTKMCILLIILLVVAGVIVLIVELTKWSLLTLHGSRRSRFKQECVRMHAYQSSILPNRSFSVNWKNQLSTKSWTIRIWSESQQNKSIHFEDS